VALKREDPLLRFGTSSTGPNSTAESKVLCFPLFHSALKVLHSLQPLVLQTLSLSTTSSSPNSLSPTARYPTFRSLKSLFPKSHLPSSQSPNSPQCCYNAPCIIVAAIFGELFNF